MRSWFWTTATLLGLALTAGHALADLIPPGGKPRPGTPPTAPVVVVVDDKAQETRLVIPRKVLAAALRADAGEPDDTQRAEGPPALHLIVAGSALALALGLGGLWLVRLRTRPAARNLVLLLAALALVAGAGGVLWADIPAPKPKPKPPTEVPAGITLSEKVTIEIVDKGDAITLITPREQLANVLDKSAPKKDEPKKP